MKPIFSGQILGKREMETHEQINAAFVRSASKKTECLRRMQDTI